MIAIENTTGGVTAPMLNNTTSPGANAERSIPLYDILTVVIGIVAVVFNGLLLIVMVQNKSTIFSSKGAYLIANVAIADLLTGLNTLLRGHALNTFRLTPALNKALLSIYWISEEASFLTIYVLSLERYIAIVFPFKARVWLSKTRTIQSCIAVWFISALSATCVAFFPLIALFCLTVALEITILTTTFFYYKIVIKLRQRRACLSSMQPTGDRSTRGNANLHHQSQLTTVVVAITFILIVTVLPFVVSGQIILVRRLLKVTKSDQKLQLFFQYYNPVHLMNFVVNPIIYAWRLPNYRFALLRTLHFR